MEESEKRSRAGRPRYRVGGGSGLPGVKDAGVVGEIVDDRRHAPPPAAAATSAPPANPTGSRGRWKLMVSSRHHHAIIFIALSKSILPFHCRGLENVMEKNERRPRAERLRWALEGLLFQLRRVSRCISACFYFHCSV